MAVNPKHVASSPLHPLRLPESLSNDTKPVFSAPQRIKTGLLECLPHVTDRAQARRAGRGPAIFGQIVSTGTMKSGTSLKLNGGRCQVCNVQSGKRKL